MKPDFSGKIRISPDFRNSIINNKIGTQDCEHLSAINEVVPSAVGCEKCLQSGDTWVTLRICLTCGHVGCCDNSMNTHATKHFHESQHPMIASFEPGQDWIYCYLDNVALSM